MCGGWWSLCTSLLERCLLFIRFIFWTACGDAIRHSSRLLSECARKNGKLRSAKLSRSAKVFVQSGLLYWAWEDTKDKALPCGLKLYYVLLGPSFKINEQLPVLQHRCSYWNVQPWAAQMSPTENCSLDVSVYSLKGPKFREFSSKKINTTTEIGDSGIRVVLELLKVLDTVDWNAECTGGTALNWFRSYCKRMVMNKYKSEYREIEYGVPQGSILGSLVFIF